MLQATAGISAVRAVSTTTVARPATGPSEHHNAILTASETYRKAAAVEEAVASLPKTGLTDSPA
jgi:hypothetical protein